MIATIYLNESRENSFAPFDFTKSMLREALVAEIDDVTIPPLVPAVHADDATDEAIFAANDAAISSHALGWATAALEAIYTQLNVGGDLVAATAYTEAYRAAGNRSLSVGDVIVLETNEAYPHRAAFSVGRFGWTAERNVRVRWAAKKFDRAVTA